MNTQSLLSITESVVIINLYGSTIAPALCGAGYDVNASFDFFQHSIDRPTGNSHPRPAPVPPPSERK
jgi:hypothetical protein